MQPRLGNLARLCFFYSFTVYPRIWEIRAGHVHRRRTPWYQHLFVRRALELADSDSFKFLETLNEFALGFLCWMRDLQGNDGGIEVRLFNRDSFGSVTPTQGNFNPRTYDGDVCLEGEAGRLDLNACWGRLCEQESTSLSVRRGLGNRRAFQAALYEACRRKGS